MKWPCSKACVVWCVLCALILLSVALAESNWLGTASGVAIVAIAALKSRLVIVQYMEVRRAAKHWRFLYETWNFTVSATLIIGYLMGRR